MVASITSIHYALKFLGEQRQTPPFLMSVVAGDELAESRSSHFKLGQELSMAPTAGLDVVNWTFLSPPGIESVQVLVLLTGLFEFGNNKS
jgi:hypothetical protein